MGLCARSFLFALRKDISHDRFGYRNKGERGIGRGEGVVVQDMLTAVALPRCAEVKHPLRGCLFCAYIATVVM